MNSRFLRVLTNPESVQFSSLWSPDTRNVRLGQSLNAEIRMNIHVYIVVTAHSIQCGNPKETTQQKINSFYEEVCSICDKHPIRRIAEEMSYDGLRRQCVDESVCFRIASELGITHHYVDPNNCEQVLLSMDDVLPIRAQMDFLVTDIARQCEGI